MGLPSYVDVLVGLQGCPAAEVLVAVLAPEGPLARVDAPVDGQVELQLKSFPHSSHVGGFFPMWSFLCLLRVDPELETLELSMHW